MDINISI